MGQCSSYLNWIQEECREQLCDGGALPALMQLASMDDKETRLRCVIAFANLSCEYTIQGKMVRLHVPLWSWWRRSVGDHASSRALRIVMCVFDLVFRSGEHTSHLANGVTTGHGSSGSTTQEPGNGNLPKIPGCACRVVIVPFALHRVETTSSNEDFHVYRSETE